MMEQLGFSNLKPNTEEYPACSDIMDNLAHLAPLNSNIDAAIEQMADGTYHTKIAIQAIGQRFQSEAKTFSLVTSLKQAQRSMFSILQEWKVDRFKSEGIGVQNVAK